MYQKLINLKPVIFLREVKLELERVSWPKREETVKLTLIVLGVSAAVGLFLGGLDYILTKFTELFIK